MEVKKISELLSEFFSQENSVACAYLFGSTVNGYATQTSDIDVAVLFEEVFDSH